jgi:hypothetical protein
MDVLKSGVVEPEELPEAAAPPVEAPKTKKLSWSVQIRFG